MNSKASSWDRCRRRIYPGGAVEDLQVPCCCGSVVDAATKSRAVRQKQTDIDIFYAQIRQLDRIDREVVDVFDGSNIVHRNGWNVSRIINQRCDFVGHRIDTNAFETTTNDTVDRDNDGFGVFIERIVDRWQRESSIWRTSWNQDRHHPSEVRSIGCCSGVSQRHGNIFGCVDGSWRRIRQRNRVSRCCRAFDDRRWTRQRNQYRFWGAGVFLNRSDTGIRWVGRCSTGRRDSDVEGLRHLCERVIDDRSAQQNCCVTSCDCCCSCRNPVGAVEEFQFVDADDSIVDRFACRG